MTERKLFKVHGTNGAPRALYSMVMPMSKLLKTIALGVLPVLLLVSVFIGAFNVQPVKADSSGGMAVGDWVKYTVSGNAPAAMGADWLIGVDWIKIEFTQVSEYFITFHFTVHCSNGTETTNDDTTGVHYYAWYIPANSKIGDTLPESNYNITLDTIKTYDGVDRAVVGFIDPTDNQPVFFDKVTGVLLQYGIGSEEALRASNFHLNAGLATGLTISITTDKQSYEQGEAITVSGQVLYNGLPKAPDNDKVLLNVTLLPSEDYSTPAYYANSPPFYTDSSGAFSFIPFAGYRLGLINIEAMVSLTTNTGRFVAKSAVEIEVIPATPVSNMTAQIDALTTLYEQAIPWGPVNFIGMRQWGPDGEKWRQQITSMFSNAQLNVQDAANLAAWPESQYGSYENMFLDGSSFDLHGTFVCGGYSDLVLSFFNGIRFNSDPAVRDLLKGLDYGPLSRGSMYTLTYHVAVVAYPITPGGFLSAVASSDVMPIVFDAWIEQKPKTFSLDTWTNVVGNAQPDTLTVENTKPSDIFSGYPMTGGVVYKNNAYWPDPKLNTGAANPTSKRTLIGLHCPVTALITNSKGQRVGILPDGTFVQEFSAQAEPSLENDGTTSWVFILPDDNYNISITGLSTGTFRLMITGDAAGGNMLDYGNQTITQGAQANLTIKTGGNSPILTLPNGETVTPQTIQLTHPSNTDWLPWIALTVIALLAVTFATLILRRKRRSRIQSLDTIPPPPPPPPPQ